MFEFFEEYLTLRQQTVANMVCFVLLVLLWLFSHAMGLMSGITSCTYYHDTTISAILCYGNIALALTAIILLNSG